MWDVILKHINEGIAAIERATGIDIPVVGTDLAKERQKKEQKKERPERPPGRVVHFVATTDKRGETVVVATQNIEDWKKGRVVARGEEAEAKVRAATTYARGYYRGRMYKSLGSDELVRKEIEAVNKQVEQFNRRAKELKREAEKLTEERERLVREREKVLASGDPKEIERFNRRVEQFNQRLQKFSQRLQRLKHEEEKIREAVREAEGLRAGFSADEPRPSEPDYVTARETPWWWKLAMDLDEKFGMKRGKGWFTGAVKTLEAAAAGVRRDVEEVVPAALKVGLPAIIGAKVGGPVGAVIGFGAGLGALAGSNVFRGAMIAQGYTERAPEVAAAEFIGGWIGGTVGGAATAKTITALVPARVEYVQAGVQKGPIRTKQTVARIEHPLLGKKPITEKHLAVDADVLGVDVEMHQKGKILQTGIRRSITVTNTVPSTQKTDYFYTQKLTQISDKTFRGSGRAVSVSVTEGGEKIVGGIQWKGYVQKIGKGLESIMQTLGKFKVDGLKINIRGIEYTKILGGKPAPPKAVPPKSFGYLPAGGKGGGGSATQLTQLTQQVTSIQTVRTVQSVLPKVTSAVSAAGMEKVALVSIGTALVKPSEHLIRKLKELTTSVSVTLPKIREGLLTAVAPITKTVPKVKTTTKTKDLTGELTDVLTTTTLTGLASVTDTMTTTATTTKTKSISPPTPPPPSAVGGITPPAPPPSPIELPSLALFGARAGRARRADKPLQKTKRKEKYAPSPAAVLFGITAKKAPKVVTGLEIRPLVVKDKKRKKKIELPVL